MIIGFIGLGKMGYPMVGHLSNKGYDIGVHNRTVEKAILACKEFNIKYHQTYTELIKQIDILILCVGNDEDVEHIITDGVVPYMKSGGIVIDHTTTSADLSIKISQLLESKNISFLDCPVSGGQIGAQRGELTVMVGGQENKYLVVKDMLSSYSKKISYMGKSGNGQLTKMVNQICIVGIIQSLAEGLRFAMNAGLNTDVVIDAISNGAAASWQMSNRASTMVSGKFDFGFTV